MRKSVSFIIFHVQKYIAINMVKSQVPNRKINKLLMVKMNKYTQISSIILPITFTKNKIFGVNLELTVNINNLMTMEFLSTLHLSTIKSMISKSISGTKILLMRADLPLIFVQTKFAKLIISGKIMRIYDLQFVF